MKYIRKFSTVAEYKQYYNDIDNYTSPNLCLCTDTSSGLHINPAEKRIVAKFYTTKPDEEIFLHYNPDSLSRIEIDEDDIYTDKNGNVHENFYNGILNAVSYTFKTEGQHIVRYTLKNPAIIGDNLFEWCTHLAGIKIPYGVTHIGACAFRECFSYYVRYPVILEIPDSVVSIGEYAFSDLWGLQHLILGSGITEIARGAFSNERYMTNYDITCKAAVAPLSWEYGAFTTRRPRAGNILYIPKDATGYEEWPVYLQSDDQSGSWTVVEI